jgi:predicted SnoaL-like aldol condensation-catalyzing enzyme
MLNRKKAICALLKGIETGDPSSVSVVNQAKYIQHNPQTHEGGEGLAALFKRLSKSNPRVNIVRIFEDGDYVFAHTEYDFSSSNIGFEVFKFEGDQTVEHWDNIQPRLGPNPSGHTMIDGPTEATDLDKTELNRKIVSSFVNEVLINGQFDALKDYIDENQYIEHNPRLSDNLHSLYSELSKCEPNSISKVQYETNHRILAEGNFVLSVNEGSYDDAHSAFYDLFRVSSGKIVEHWDTAEKIPPRIEWKNNNGKF